MLCLCDIIILVKVVMGDESVPVHALALMKPEMDKLLWGGELGRGRHQQSLEHIADVPYVELRKEKECRVDKDGDVGWRKEVREEIEVMTKYH